VFENEHAQFQQPEVGCYQGTSQHVNEHAQFQHSGVSYYPSQQAKCSENGDQGFDSTTRCDRSSEMIKAIIDRLRPDLGWDEDRCRKKIQYPLRDLVKLTLIDMGLFPPGKEREREEEKKEKICNAIQSLFEKHRNYDFGEEKVLEFLRKKGESKCRDGWHIQFYLNRFREESGQPAPRKWEQKELLKRIRDIITGPRMGCVEPDAIVRRLRSDLGWDEDCCQEMRLRNLVKLTLIDRGLFPPGKERERDEEKKEKIGKAIQSLFEKRGNYNFGGRRSTNSYGRKGNRGMEVRGVSNST
jgi:hypothetical protein